MLIINNATYNKEILIEGLADQIDNKEAELASRQCKKDRKAITLNELKQQLQDE